MFSNLELASLVERLRHLTIDTGWVTGDEAADAIATLARQLAERETEIAAAKAALWHGFQQLHSMRYAGGNGADGRAWQKLNEIKDGLLHAYQAIERGDHRSET